MSTAESSQQVSAPDVKGEAQTTAKRYPDYVAPQPRVVLSRHPEKDLTLLTLSRLPGMRPDQVLTAIEQPAKKDDPEGLMRFAGPGITATRSLDEVRGGGKEMRVRVQLHGFPTTTVFFLQGPTKDGMEFLAFEPSIYVNEGGSDKKAMLTFRNWPGASRSDPPKAFEVDPLPSERHLVPMPRRFLQGFGATATVSAVTRFVDGEVCVEVEDVHGVAPTLFRPFQAPSESGGSGDGGEADEGKAEEQSEEQAPAEQDEAEAVEQEEAKAGKRRSPRPSRPSRAKPPKEEAPIAA